MLTHRHILTTQVKRKFSSPAEHLRPCLNQTPKECFWTGTAYTAKVGEEDVINLARQVSLHINHTSITNNFARLSILLTPELVQYAKHDVLPKTLLKGHIPQSLDVVTAVVDRLPSRYTAGQTSPGMTFMLQVDKKPLPALPQGLMRDGAGHPGYIDFRPVSTNVSTRTCDVRLPLANTIFLTGHISTLTYSKYSNIEGSGFEIESCSDLEWHTIEVPEQSSIRIRPNLTILTPFRCVSDSVGNIVRRLYSSQPDTETSFERNLHQSASQELEATLPLYFKACDIEPQRLGIWALIAPSSADRIRPHLSEAGKDYASTLLDLDSVEIRRQWENTTGLTKCMERNLSMEIAAFLQHGGRVCRVLSGGGGWGKKAGLICLDPDIRYTTRELRGIDGWEFDFESEDNQYPGSTSALSKYLNPIVKQGEHVMFLTPANVTSATVPTEVMQNRMIFGTAKLHANQRSQIESEIEPKAKRNMNASICHGRFGAMSQLGLTLKWDRPMPDISETRFDVPLSSIEFKCNADANDASLRS